MSVTLTLIRGHSGSGKTTLAKRLTGAVHCETDQFWSDTPFDPTRLEEAHRTCLERTRDALQIGKSAVVSNTFTRHWEMEPYIQLAELLGIELQVIRCTGMYPNVNGVPAEKVQQQIDRMEDVPGELFVNDLLLS